MGDSDEVCNVNNTYVIVPGEAYDYMYSTEETLLITVFLPIIAGLGFLSNAAFLFTLFRVEGMRTMTNFYLGNLAFSDLGYLITALARYTWTYAELAPMTYGTPWPTSVGCQGPLVVTYCLYYSSVFLITLVTLERYLAICHPLKHRTFLDGAKRALKLVAVSWTVSLGLSLFEANPVSIDIFCLNFVNNSNVDGLFVVRECIVHCDWCWGVSSIFDTCQFVLCFFTALFMYVQIVLTLSKRSVAMSGGSETTAERTVQARNAVARMLAVNSAIFFASLFPFQIINITNIVYTFAGFLLFSYDTVITMILFGRVVALINSAINPVVYSVTNPRYRKAFLEAFGLGKSENTSIGTISKKVGSNENTKT